MSFEFMRTESANDRIRTFGKVMAVGRRNPAAGLIFHSDRGSQYTSAV